MSPLTPAPEPIALRGRVVTPEAVLADGVVVLDGGRITWVGPVADARAEAGAPPAAVAAGARAASDRTILPGLVDLHNHGGAGVGFPDAADAGSARRGVAEHLAHGTTRMVASLVTAAPDTLRARVATLAELADTGEILGIHLEGPFLNAERRGAHDPTLLIDGDPVLTAELLALGRGHVVSMTIAPDSPGVVGPGGVAQTLIAGGAVPSFGHTDAAAPAMRAALVEAVTAMAGGARSRPTVTHLFNGMRPIHHRDPGPVPPALALARLGQVVVELIGDGTHLSADLVREVFDLVGAEHIALVTDAMAATGMADGQYRLGGLAVQVTSGVARLVEGGSIAGGTAHLIDVVRTTVDGGVGLREAVLAASATPATVLGTADLGALRVGNRADVVVTDADLRVQQVFRDGVDVAEPIVAT
ncbi:N-acetylglucosamine-6-phosphate deacetylase [Occultella glacieicola]|uniref:N-acetylglucosamine-6-phosphate deacetylase n=1 Tax=Occultella glacieicola TaxID=2518684 RepID=A0ABY2E602_9MICO|nr:amidohydrolase family protein [Occultella glacieicola]TDE96020.1 N-acetylglucosamine-6-phosphate deacetylase [Occultella glacieicola]